MEGCLNKVANCFSRYYALLQRDSLGMEYVDIDRQLNSEGEDLMEEQHTEIGAITLRDKTVRWAPERYDPELSAWQSSQHSRKVGKPMPLSKAPVRVPREMVEKLLVE